MRNVPDAPARDHDEDFEELAAGFALGALDRADAERFRQHLPECGRCRALVAEYGVVANLLPETLDEMEASPGLRQRIMTAAAAERPSRAPPPAAPPLTVVRPEPTARPELPRRLGWWALSLAAMFAVTVGLGFWNYRLQQQVQDQAAALQVQQRALAVVAAGGRQTALAGTDQAPRVSGVVVQSPDGSQVYVLMRDLPPLPPQQAYQAWVIAGGTPAPAGVLGPAPDGTLIAQLDRPLGSAEAVAISVEPFSGSVSPTGPIVALGQV